MDSERSLIAESHINFPQTTFSDLLEDTHNIDHFVKQLSEATLHLTTAFRSNLDATDPGQTTKLFEKTAKEYERYSGILQSLDITTRGIIPAETNELLHIIWELGREIAKLSRETATTLSTAPSDRASQCDTLGQMIHEHGGLLKGLAIIWKEQKNEQLWRENG